MKGSQESLTTVVVKETANWMTPMEDDSSNVNPNLNRRTTLVSQVNKHGQAAPASSSSLGSRQGLSEQDWRTPGASDGEGGVMEMREGCAGKYKLRDHVAAEEIKGTNKQWGTPSCMDTLPARSPEALARAKEKGGCKNLREEVVQWATPCSRDHHPNGQSKGSKMDLGNQVQKQWATPIMGDSHLASTPEVAQKRIEEGKVTLSRQMAAQWGTPTARDHKSGRGNEDRQYKELTPMVERQQSGKLNPRWVETLMGLPIGWTMPSCSQPVTIAPTNAASSATALCQQQQSELFEH